MKYIRNLSDVDDRVLSVSPQIGKQNRPFVGIIIICNNKPYCIPLSSPKPKHTKMKNDVDFSKIYDGDGKLIGVLNFNLMIPVNYRVLTYINLKAKPWDTYEEQAYKSLMTDQLDWCQLNENAIVTKANKLYKMITVTPEKSRMLTRRCCDFLKLEKVLESYLANMDK